MKGSKTEDTLNYIALHLINSVCSNFYSLLILKEIAYSSQDHSVSVVPGMYMVI